MNEKKLRYAWIGTLVGAFVLTIAMVLVWKFKFYDEVTSELTRTKGEFTTKQTRAAELEKTLKAALLSQQRLALAEGELQYFRTRYRSLPFDLTTSPLGGDGPRNATFVRYLNEYASGFGLEARRQLIRAADESGVQIDTNIKVEAPPQNPEDVQAPASGLLKPQTEPLAVSVTGTFGSILNFFQVINRSEILMAIGNVKMEGTSPTIVATFTITPYLLVTGPSQSQAAIPGIDAALPGNAAGAGGAPAAGADGSGQGFAGSGSAPSSNASSQPVGEPPPS